MTTEAKFRYYIVTLDGVIATDSSKLAKEYAQDEYNVVIDLYDNTVMVPTPADGSDAVGESIYEVKA